MNNVEQVMAQHGKYIASPHGISMRPMLRQGRDTVLLVPPVHPLRRGDVILYRRPSGKLVLHRIVRAKKDGYLLGADNLPHRERGVQPDWVIGVMRGFYRDEKYIAADADSRHLAARAAQQIQGAKGFDLLKAVGKKHINHNDLLRLNFCVILSAVEFLPQAKTRALRASGISQKIKQKMRIACPAPPNFLHVWQDF